MRSRQRQFTWQTAALVLAALVAFAVPVAAKPGSQSKKLTSKASSSHQRSGRQDRRDKLDKEMRSRSAQLFGKSKVILTVKPGHEANAEKEIRKLGGRLGRRLKLVNGMSVELPNRVIKTISERSEVLSVHHDRPVGGHMSRAAVAVGARSMAQNYGYDGAGVGVAVIDSGITGWHDDLGYQGSSPAVRVVNGQRVTGFVDFVNGLPNAYDDNGHGTHVAGIIGGTGYASNGAHAGIAPAAHLVSLKVLDQNGGGVISDVIAAFEWAVANRVAHNIRVINLSVGARVTESYETDPLTLAAKSAVDAGIVVVTAAGNLGQKTVGTLKKTQYGAISAPGNAPWVLTVGAYSTQGTTSTSDDKIAPYSSRGPTAVDYGAKPDIVAPGTGIVSLVDSTSNFYTSKSAYLLPGSDTNNPIKPYLSLSGTSMASPIVAGTVAVMLQANPTLSPNLVKAILQYTARSRNNDRLTQGAGYMSTYGAVKLARFFATAQPGDPYPTSWTWSKQIIWGNHRLTGGVLKPNGNAWASNVVWGTLADDPGENIVWGTLCETDCENIVWGTLDDGENIVWGTVDELGENIVWGTADDGENIVWGTADDENIVWGTTCGSEDCENIVWGTSMDDMENIVWGTADDGENIVWGTNVDLENIVWGTSEDNENIVWGTTADEDVTWGSSNEDAQLFDDPNAPPVNYDYVLPDDLLPPPFPPPPPPAPDTTGTSTSTGTEGGL